MDTIKILIFFLACNSSVDAQTYSKIIDLSKEFEIVDNGENKPKDGYLSILNNDQTWISIASSAFEPPSSFQYSFSEDSILIQNNYYFERIQSNNQDGSESYVEGYYRELDGKIYKKLEGNFIEKIIIDMSLILGDSIHFDQGIFSSTLVVVKVDSVLYNDEVTRKRIELKCSQSPDDFGSKYWVEGIGELYSGEYCILDGGSDYINCVLDEDGDKIYSNVTGDTNCWITTNVVDLPLTSLFVFPNPSHDKVNISGFSNQISSGIVYNSVGQIISHFHNEQIDISKYASGVYFIKVVDKSNRIYSTKFVKGH